MLKKILPESNEYVILLRKSPLQHALYKAFCDHIRRESAFQNSSYNPIKAFAICIKVFILIWIFK
jgi:ABC-type amino acid transport system permease subunit